MTVDYNLVILGGSLEARYAAEIAARQRARVALVEPEGGVARGLWGDAVRVQTLQHLMRICRQGQQAQAAGLSWGDACSQPELKPMAGWDWASALVDYQSQGRSLANLSALGVDVVVGQGKFQPQPRLGVAVNGRVLRSATYLLAPGSSPLQPAIDGLGTSDYLTVEQFFQPTGLAQWPDQLFVLGDDVRAVELAQLCRRLGIQVTLVVSSPHLLPMEDPEAAARVQYHLEAEGVQILTQATVTQARSLDGKVWMQVGNRAIAADHLLVAAGRRPNLEELALAPLELAADQKGLRIDRLLRTSHPRIFACGAAVDAYPFANVARYEAAIAVHNALSPIGLMRQRVNYHTVPWLIGTDPPLARVGLTEAAARQRHGTDVITVQQSFQLLDQAQISCDTTGWCKLITRRDGTLLGGHIVGPQAGELIGAIAQALQQREKITTFSQMSHPHPSFMEVLGEAARTWQQGRSRQHPNRLDLWETFYNWRRDWDQG
ncbi:MAG: NAD(P)/FAD-dependent oxidoreductase [Synechococcales bacterium]|nr:NAD(P)/FAD-dependent oxidoreductase [Synechococcales bacterium]